MKIPFTSGRCKLTSPFGIRTLNGVTQPHKGYDIVGIGTYDVSAVVGGKVAASTIITDKSNKTWEWGNYVRIDGEDGRAYFYCHLASRAVSKGQTVIAGQKLGLMGNTGSSQGAHLHFEIRENGVSINPEPIVGIPNKKGTYELPSLDRDLAVLVQKNKIKSPDYWRDKAKTVPYLAELIHGYAEAVK